VAVTALVHSALCLDGQRLGDIPIDDISGTIRQAGTFVWLGLCEPDDILLRKVQLAFGRHDLATEDAHHALQRPKIEACSGSLFIVLKTVLFEDGHVVYGETHLFVDASFQVSVRRGISSSDAQMLRRCEDGTEGLPKGQGFGRSSGRDGCR